MSYDMQPGETLAMPDVAPTDPHDLEALVMLLELGAIFLTVAPESTFTEDELVAEAIRIGGEELPVHERDLRLVLRGARFVRKTQGRYRLV